MSKFTQSSLFQRAASLLPLPNHTTLRLSSSSLELGTFHLRMEVGTNEMQQRLGLSGGPDGATKNVFWPKRFRHLVREVKVHVPTGLTFFDSRLIVQSGQIYEEAHSSTLQNRVGTPPGKVRKKYEAGEYLVVPTIHAYWHWAVEWLPQVLGLMEINKDITILTTSRQPSYVRQGLELVGVQVEYLDQVWVEVNNLWIVDKAFFGHIHKDDAVRTRAFGLEIAKKADPKATLLPKVYVSRQGFSRPMANEPELENWLKSEGFTIFRANDLESLADQARLFTSAQILIGPTGSSLSNVVFMHTGTRAIELSVWHQNWPECESLSACSGVLHEKITLKASKSMPYGDGWDAILKLKASLNLDSQEN